MSNNRGIYSRDKLHSKIEAYFDCRLTDAEEEELRMELAQWSGDADPAVDEARALMGFRRITPKNAGMVPRGTEVPRKPRRVSRRLRAVTVASIAASVALIITTALYVVNSNLHSGFIPNMEGGCYAYVNGRYIDDPDVVLDLAADGLLELNENCGDDSPESVVAEALGDDADLLLQFDSNNDETDV